MSACEKIGLVLSEAIVDAVSGYMQMYRKLTETDIGRKFCEHLKEKVPVCHDALASGCAILIKLDHEMRVSSSTEYPWEMEQKFLSIYSALYSLAQLSHDEDLRELCSLMDTVKAAITTLTNKRILGMMLKDILTQSYTEAQIQNILKTHEASQAAVSQMIHYCLPQLMENLMVKTS